MSDISYRMSDTDIGIPHGIDSSSLLSSLTSDFRFPAWHSDL